MKKPLKLAYRRHMWSELAQLKELKDETDGIIEVPMTRFARHRLSVTATALAEFSVNDPERDESIAKRLIKILWNLDSEHELKRELEGENLPYSDAVHLINDVVKATSSNGINRSGLFGTSKKKLANPVSIKRFSDSLHLTVSTLRNEYSKARNFLGIERDMEVKFLEFLWENGFDFRKNENEVESDMESDREVRFSEFLRKTGFNFRKNKKKSKKKKDGEKESEKEARVRKNLDNEDKLRLLLKAWKQSLLSSENTNFE